MLKASRLKITNKLQKMTKHQRLPILQKYTTGIQTLTIKIALKKGLIWDTG